MRLLLIEDDALIGDGIQAGLNQVGYAIDWVQNAEAGEHALNIESYDGLILDVGLPRQSGLSLLKKLRSAGNKLPVLILTARDSIHDKIKGLDTGADDYMIKPFDLEELAARLRAILRRAQGRATPCLEYGALRLDPAAKILTLEAEPITLSQKELLILQTLLENIGKILSRSRLEESLYGWDDMIESNAVEVHIHHLRKKLGKNLIRTIRGIGYMIPKLS
ncbi:MAG: hypothetical protein RL368_687 [Pseudomonadota bacterium]|jgi:two-component system response regulator QseB